MISIPYMREWISYHINLGIDKFVFYDDDVIGEDTRKLGEMAQ
jgi:predicted enzyme involved in methoxymalonyl-ACP biosynthesis